MPGGNPTLETAEVDGILRAIRLDVEEYARAFYVVYERSLDGVPLEGRRILATESLMKVMRSRVRGWRKAGPI